MLALGLMTAILGMVVILAPFFLADQKPLAPASAINSVETLTAVKKAILRRYVEDEKAFTNQVLSPRVWKSRKIFLMNRYIDTVKRLDYLKSTTPN